MRYAAGHKQKTRAKIVRAAGKVFRREGYHAAGVDKVMEEAGLTAGGFYAHFVSKEALLAATIEPTAAEVGGRRDKELESLAGRAWVEAFIERYLAPRHMRNTEGGCPLPALASEVARAGSPVKASFESVVLRFATRLVDARGANSRRKGPSRSSRCASAGWGSRDRSTTTPWASGSSRLVANWQRRVWPPILKRRLKPSLDYAQPSRKCSPVRCVRSPASHPMRSWHSRVSTRDNRPWPCP